MLVCVGFPVVAVNGATLQWWCMGTGFSIVGAALVAGHGL